MIYTFYSYKGGVGRSMALVNMAELMYRHDYKVLMVDWDLEAPGLERFFPGEAERVQELPGVIDMLLAYKNKAASFDPEDGPELFPPYDLKDYVVDIYPDQTTPGHLWLLPAGHRAGRRGFDNYIERVITFDWLDFYQNWEGEIYFKWLGEKFKSLADVVFIDSRTGITEMGGVCTDQLADVVVALCGANDQNINGTFRMLERLRDPELQALRNNRQLKVLAVPSRIEILSETERLNSFRKKFREKFSRFLPNELKNKEDFFLHLEIPYVPLYAFEEIIAVNQKETKDRSIEMERAYNRLFEILMNFSPKSFVKAGRVEIEIEPPYGTIPPDSKFYIERAGDEQCYARISQSYATTLFIKASRQMGKTSLLHRMLYRVGQEYNKLSAFVDFQEFPKQYFDDEEDFLMQFCLSIGNDLGLPPAVDKYWQGAQSSSLKCRDYLAKYIIPQVNAPFILALDELDRVLASPFRDNFFGMLRAWHNLRARNPNFARLSLLLSSSTEPYLFIDNPNQSPFNVAEVIILQDFTRAEVDDLNQRHPAPLDQKQVDELMALVDGHPFLTRLALYQATTGQIAWDTLLVQATADNGPFGDHLRHYLDLMRQKPDLRQALADICRYQTCDDDQTFHRLKGAGLVKRDGQRMVLRNNLYTRYFKERLDV